MWLLGWLVATLVVDESQGTWQVRVGQRVLARESYEQCQPRVLLVERRGMTVGCRLEKGARAADVRFVWDERGERLLSRTESAGWAGLGVRNGVVLLSDGERQRSWAYEGGTFRRVAGGGRPKKMAPPPPQIRLRQSSLLELRKARPEAAKQGVLTIEERVEAWQRLNGRIWWAKGFYEGEGWQGVGGFGYFDEWTGERRSYAPRELVNWSVGAMLVERDAVWMALVSHGEWGDAGGGVWRFDRIREEMERLGGEGSIVCEMQRVGDDLVMATDWGVMVWDGARMRRFAVDHQGELREGR